MIIFIFTFTNSFVGKRIVTLGIAFQIQIFCKITSVPNDPKLSLTCPKTKRYIYMKHIYIWNTIHVSLWLAIFWIITSLEFSLPCGTYVGCKKSKASRRKSKYYDDVCEKTVKFNTTWLWHNMLANVTSP